MAEKAIMPKLGLTMTEGTITEIFVKEGDYVNEGDVIMTFETNKVTDQIVAPVSGYVLKVLVDVDDEVNVADPVCFIGEQGETV